MSTFSVLIGSCVRGAGSSVVGDSRSAGEAVQLPRNEQPQFTLLLPVSDSERYRNFAVPGVVLG